MKDETYSFISDVKEKGITARSAKNRRSHTGKGGRCRLPHENMSKKELQKMNGECKSYSLNSPMQKEEFKEMPDDLKVIYIKAVRSKYGIPDNHLGKAMGYSQQTFSAVIKRLGLGIGRDTNHHKKWDKEGFYAWWNGVDKLPTPVIEEPEHCEPDPVKREEPEVFMEDDLPMEVLFPEYKPIPVTAVPASGSMTFRCTANMALNTLKELLANEMVDLHVSWGVIVEGSVEV